MEFTDTNYLIFERESNALTEDIVMSSQTNIQKGNIYKDYLLDAISGERYYYRKIGGSITFITGRYMGLVFNVFSTHDSSRRYDSILSAEIKNYSKEINGIKIDKSFHLGLNKRIEYSSEDRNLRLVLNADSTYSYYRYEYPIDHGKFTLNHNFLKLDSEPRISYEQVDKYNSTRLFDHIYVQHKVFLNDSLLLLGTLPYGFSEKHLKRIE